MSDRHKNRTAESEAARQREMRENKFALTPADLIPKNGDKPFSPSSLRIFRKRRLMCRDSLADFATTYCMGDGGFLKWPPTGRLLEILAQMQRAVSGKGCSTAPFHIRMSRGHGKTSFVKCAVAYALAYGLRRYVVVVSAGTEGASGFIKEIWGLFEQNRALYQDFPELCVPVRLAGDNSNRAKRITFKGRRCLMRKSAAEIRLPVMEGYAASGSILSARSFLSGTRGLVKNTLRPDLVIFDDVQTDEMADSAIQIRAAERKIDGAFMGLGGHQKKIAALMTSTPIRPFDLSEAYAERPSWLTFTFPMISKWPDCWKSDDHFDHWGEYFRLKDRDTVSGGDESGAYYRANREEMDRGAEVLSEDNFDRDDGEVSAVQHAFNLYYLNGSEAFSAEYQMKPVRSSAVYDLSPALVRSRLSGAPPFQLPHGVTDAVATIDVMNEAGLRWAILGFGAGNVSAVIAYGRHPASGKPIYAKTDPIDKQDSAVARALDELARELAAARLLDADGHPVPVRALGVDAGWRSRTVGAFCRRIAGTFQRVEAMRGVSWEHYRPIAANGKPRAGVTLADEWAYHGTGIHGPFLAFHSDYWQEVAQRAWFNEPLQPGSICLFGKDPAAHKTFADEVCADRIAEKDRTRAGQFMWRWYTSGPNHLGDCVKMGFALAYWHKLYSAASPADMADAPAPPKTAFKRPRVKFSPVASSKVRFQ